MTEPQRITLMADWWPAACKAQGWNKNDRAIRMRVLSEAVGRTLESASELDSTGDIDRVKAHLGMLADNVAATIETDHPEEGRARRLRVKIREELLPCLAVYMGISEPVVEYEGPTPAEKEAAESYLAEIIRDKFQRGARHASTRVLTLDDLTADPIIVPQKNSYSELREIPSQLDQVVMTLARAVQAKRAAAGDTLHDMKMKAGLECDCRPCCDRRLRLLPAKSAKQTVPAPIFEKEVLTADDADAENPF